MWDPIKVKDMGVNSPRETQETNEPQWQSTENGQTVNPERVAMIA